MGYWTQRLLPIPDPFQFPTTVLYSLANCYYMIMDVSSSLPFFHSSTCLSRPSSPNEWAMSPAISATSCTTCRSTMLIGGNWKKKIRSQDSSLVSTLAFGSRGPQFKNEKVSCWILLLQQFKQFWNTNKIKYDQPWWPSTLRHCVISLNWYMLTL